jgi:STE24 endopeptidase
MKRVFAVMIFILLATALVHAQTPDSMHTTTAQTFNVDSATEHWLNTLTPAQRAKSDAYFEGGYWLLLWSTLYTIAVCALFLLTGLSKRIKTVVSRIRMPFVQTMLYGMVYILITWVLTFPLTVYQDFYREHQYNLSNLGFAGWMTEQIESLVLMVIFAPLILSLVYIAMRRAQKTWWIWGAGISIFFAAFGSFIAPVFLAPIFNKYEPLKNGQLKTEILSLARANEIPAENVYQFDASKQSDRVSANVSGFASTTRISLNDNLLKRCTPAEIRSVMGHEMGHYAMHHVYKGLIETGVFMVILFAIVNALFNAILKRYGAGLGIESVSDVAGLPLLVALFTFMFFLATPISNTMIRTQESEADLFGLNAAREPDGEAHVDMMLSEYRKIDPGYWEEIFFFDHPSGRNRVHMAMQWKAEHLNDCK